MEWEEARWFPNEVFTKLASHGFLGLKYPEEYGGQGGDYLHDAVFTEELARCGSGGRAAGRRSHAGSGTPPVRKVRTGRPEERDPPPATARGQTRARWSAPPP